jgi:hypothetical protein
LPKLLDAQWPFKVPKIVKPIDKEVGVVKAVLWTFNDYLLVFKLLVDGLNLILSCMDAVGIFRALSFLF